MRTVALIQARMGSHRFKGKSLIDLNGAPLLRWTVDSCYRSHVLDDIVVCTTTLPQDDELVEACQRWGIKTNRGPNVDVLSRFMRAAQLHGAELIVRMCGDSPLISPRDVDMVVELATIRGIAYATQIKRDGTLAIRSAWGRAVEAFRFETLEDEFARLDVLDDPLAREHVTYRMSERGANRCAFITCDPGDARLAVDTPRVLERVLKYIRTKRMSCPEL